jgi:hypothetical protein
VEKKCAIGISVEKVGISKKSARVQKKSFRKKIGKPRQTLKNTKYIHFFQNFKHIKQQQHQINTLAHKYGEIIDIYVVTSGCQIKNYTSKLILNAEGPLQYKMISHI